MTSALLFVALLIVVELSYRRWVRRTRPRRPKVVVDVATAERAETKPRTVRAADAEGATVIPMPPRGDASRAARRIG